MATEVGEKRFWLTALLVGVLYVMWRHWTEVPSVAVATAPTSAPTQTQTPVQSNVPVPVFYATPDVEAPIDAIASTPAYMPEGVPAQNQFGWLSSEATMMLNMHAYVASASELARPSSEGTGWYGGRRLWDAYQDALSDQVTEDDIQPIVRNINAVLAQNDADNADNGFLPNGAEPSY